MMMSMRALVSLLVASATYGLRKVKRTKAANPSSGCGGSFQWSKGSRGNHNIRFNDPQLGNVDREYSLKIPSSASINTPVPLFIFLHGQYGQARNTGYGFDDLADREKFITLYPQGLSEDGGCGTGWNTGMQGDSSTCNSNANRWSCCYQSCRTLGKCTSNNAQCAWASCYDDVAYVNHLIDVVSAGACINQNAVIISGESNGGMQMWEFLKRTPERFAAMFPVYGAPLVGYAELPAAASSVSLFYLTGRSDTTIPAAGGDGDGWLYESAYTSVKAVAVAHGCDNTVTTIDTPYSGGSKNVTVREYKNCASGGKVMLSRYDGGHSIPSQINHEELTWWFASQVI